MKRKILALMLIAVLSLAACSNGNKNNNNNTTNKPDTTPTTPENNGTTDLPNNSGTADDTMTSAWGQHTIFGGIPEYNLGGTLGDITDETDNSYVDVNDVKDEDYKSYMTMLRDNGFEKESETGNEIVYYNATTGSRVMLSYNANNDNLLRITSYKNEAAS